MPEPGKPSSYVPPTPAQWLEQSYVSFTRAMRATGNVPDRELWHCQNFAFEALRAGLPSADLDLIGTFAARWAGNTDAEMAIWRSVATAMETMAIQRMAAENDAAHDEATASMEQVPV